MDAFLRQIRYSVALLLAGSAILLNSCRVSQPPVPIDEENVITRLVDSMTMISTDNGKKTQRFFTPLLEDYDSAKEPFQEYRKGIEVISYDSLGVQSSDIVADYALFWTNRDLWELKGNVVVNNEDGRTLYTQQLFWDRKIKRIYSNVDSKVIEGGDIFIGEGFEADEDFRGWTFRRFRGNLTVDVEPTEPAADSVKTAASDGPSAASDAQPADPEP